MRKVQGIKDLQSNKPLPTVWGYMKREFGLQVTVPGEARLRPEGLTQPVLADHEVGGYLIPGGYPASVPEVDPREFPEA